MQDFKKQIFQKNQPIVIFGSKVSDKIYLVTKGTVETRFMDETYEQKEGQFINLISGLSQKSQITSVKAISEVEIMIIPISKFSYFIQHENIALRMFRELSFFLKEILTNGSILEENNIEFNLENSEGYMFDLGEYLFNKGLYRRAKYTFEKIIANYPNSSLNKKAASFLDTIKFHLVDDDTVEKNIYNKGATIYSQFEEDNKFAFLNKGLVKFFRYTGQNEYYITTLEAKTIFGQMSFNSQIRDLSCISYSDDTEILFFPLEEFTQFIKSQNQKVILNILIQFATRAWKGGMRVEHFLNFKKHTNIYHQIYDILYTFYEIENKNDKKDGIYSFHFNLTVDEIFQSSMFPKTFNKDNLLQVIQESSFLSFDKNDRIICNDIRSLYASCYKSRQNKY